MADSSPGEIANPWLRQLFRFGLVGVTTNLLGYLLYLLLTYLGITPKITMSMLYFIGAVAGFWGNRRLTFRDQGSLLGSGLRYTLAHGIGYLLNLMMLIVFVDRLGFAHQWVQGIAILAVAGYLFVAFKLFVFRD